MSRSGVGSARPPRSGHSTSHSVHFARRRGRGIRVRPDRRCDTDPDATHRRRRRADSVRRACRSDCESHRARRVRAATRAPASTCPHRDRRADARPRAADACSRKRRAECVGSVGRRRRNAQHQRNRISPDWRGDASRGNRSDGNKPRSPPSRAAASPAAACSNAPAHAASNAGKPLRAQCGDDAGEHVAHAADGHAGIAGADHARAFRPRAATMVPAPLSTTTRVVAFRDRTAPRRSDRAARRRCVHAEQARGFARMRREDGVRRQRARVRAASRFSASASSTQRLVRAERALEQRAPPLALAQARAERDDVRALESQRERLRCVRPRAPSLRARRASNARDVFARAWRRSTSPAPARSAASAHSMIAPPLPWSPPTHSTWPVAPLCAVATCAGASQRASASGSSQARVRLDAVEASARHVERRQSTASPAWSSAAPVRRPGLSADELERARGAHRRAGHAAACRHRCRSARRAPAPAPAAR